MQIASQHYMLFITFIELCAFGSAIYVIKTISRNHCFSHSMNYFKAYFIISFFLAFFHAATLFMGLPQFLNVQIFLLFAVCFILWLSIDPQYRFNTILLTSYSILLLIYLSTSFYFEFNLQDNLIFHAFGSLTLFPLLLRSALSKAKQLKNVGFHIIALAFIIVIIFSAIETFYIYRKDLQIAYTFAVFSSSSGFILVIIGFLVKILMSEYNVLNTIALSDPLTKLNNRRGLYHLLETVIPTSNRNQLCFSVITMDIDFFKKVNDNYGHDGGDIVLQAFADMLKSSLRNTDIAARLGGEEFILVLPNTNKKQALKVAEKVRVTTELLEIKVNGTIVKITSSFGVETSCENFDIDELFKNADRALYESKFTGRNKVTHFGDL